ncbi:DUF968 domain-containing protein [Achromobacter marplatensis]|uniref:DUF968 domain-containing protein n=1 Tax=Achromobacter marplatensis TaxID=470868 RepID=UPI001F196DAA|nr:hypothetical protein [Achromobacter marplatensis]
MTWNSTLKRSTPMRTNAPMSWSKAERKEGLGRKVEIVMGFYRPPGHKLPTLLRSEQHRRNVAALNCACCGRHGPSQAAHANITKGMGLKACDSLTFPLCPECHRDLDQGGKFTKEARRQREWVYVDATRAELMALRQWTPEIELHYRAACEPLHGASA